MKKYFIIIAAGLLVTLIACNNEKKDDEVKQPETKANTAAQKNLEAVHAFNKAFEAGDFTSLRSLIADNAVDHAGPAGDVKGADSIIATLSQWAKMATDMKSVVKKEFADDETVIQWMTVSGKMVTDGFGMKKGDAYSMDVVEITKFNSDNKAIEHWEFATMADMMKMAGGGNPAK